MSSRRLSTLWAREMRGSQTSYISQHSIPSTTPLVSASCPSMRSTRSSLRPSFAIRSYSQGKVADLAKNFSRRPGTAAETYVAYGMTQKLFEACSSQADYKIPQASQKGAEVPKTAAGEDLGVGEGWWYRGELNICRGFNHYRFVWKATNCGHCCRTRS
jgi:cytochrome b pre-mRNA-processing protein 3